MIDDAIAVVGLGCRYPDASDPEELWELVLAGRRAFRRMPDVRLNLDAYSESTGRDPDCTYVRYAAVLEGWQFDRERFRVPGQAYRVTDPAHWLALEVAAETLAAAGYPDGAGLDRDRVAVLVGNTMNGEFSRAAVLRLRWPYVRRTVAASLREEGWDAETTEGILSRLETRYKAPFAVPNDESLAGGLANTIAGRICNQFDFHGGGYTVDGACASSLLAITNACSALVARDADFVLAGGVDLSLDPFEMVGFARTGALARTEMRVYDAAPTGFWPGEGCGMVALMRYSDARAGGRTPIAVIRGWGVSSDGKGGISRPEQAGQILALSRAYQRSGFGPETVSLFEGHGTGTAVGDRVELHTLVSAHRARRPGGRAAVGSVKANIGHTKAAAGAAGFLKAALALQHQVIPPTVGCVEPHELLRDPETPLRAVAEAEPWPDAPLRAAISAMGFGGINAHLVIESPSRRRRRVLSARDRRTARGGLSHEVFALGADSAEELAVALRRLRAVAPGLSFAEHLDLAGSLAETAAGPVRSYRAAMVARNPDHLTRQVDQAIAMLPGLERSDRKLVAVAGTFLAKGSVGAVGLLFTCQGVRVPADLGALRGVFPEIEEHVGAAAGQPSADTATAQPAIFRSSLAGLYVLDRLGIDAVAAAGHSLGEITALHWAGAIAEGDASKLVSMRGRIMSETGQPGTGMVSIAARRETVADLIGDDDLVIAADNGISQAVAGSLPALDRLVSRATASGLAAQHLQVSHAFHSPAVAAAAAPLARCLDGLDFSPITRPVYSTVTGGLLPTDTDIRDLLTTQVTAQVRFAEAVTGLAADCDLLLEVGPGHTLAAAASAITEIPVVAMDVGGTSAEGFGTSAAACYALGATSDLRPLFAERFCRPFDVHRTPGFLTSPCEQELTGDQSQCREAAPPILDEPSGNLESQIRTLVAEAVELPVAAVAGGDRLLSDLHLNSLRVAQLTAAVARACGRVIPAEPLSLSDLSVSELVTLVTALPERSAEPDRPLLPTGVRDWHRVLVPAPEPVELPDLRAARAWRVHGRGPLRELVEPLLIHNPDAAPAIVVFVPEEPTDDDVASLLELTRAAVGKQTPITVVDQGDSASGFMATIRNEIPGQVARWLRAGGAAGAATVAKVLSLGADAPDEVVVDEAGRACVPGYRPLPLTPADTPVLEPGDVVLITGGGKGIGFETAAALSRQAGVHVALTGRSRPEHDAELRSNLLRLEQSGAAYSYHAADVTDPRAVAGIVAGITEAYGPVTVLIHSSGINRPARFQDVALSEYADHAAPKLHGLRHLIEALDAAALRVVVTYGSVIGRFGLPGEAHYALANGRMRDFVKTLSERLPHAWVCDIDWTVWSGAGMGERLDVVDGLTRSGVVPLPVEHGIDLLLALLAGRPPEPTVLVTGRLPQLGRPPADPDLRFIERVLLHVPEVELIAEADLSSTADPYLADHQIDGLRVLPAVCALEAMAQAATVVAGKPMNIVSDARFDRPVIVPADGVRTLRICALAAADGAVEVVLRTDEDGFTVDHFTARITSGLRKVVLPPCTTSPLPEHSGSDLYGSLFFHRGRFQRLRRYEHLEAQECTALLSGGHSGADGGDGADSLLLGDPTANDASIHVLQGCVPHRRLLPVGCTRFTCHPYPGSPGDQLFVSARERSHQGRDYTYDVALTDRRGEPLVSWEGLLLRDVGPLEHAGGLPEVLVAPYLQRGATALVPGAELSCQVVPATRPAAGVKTRRADRTPVPSRSLLNGLAMTMAGKPLLACDWTWARPDSDVTEVTSGQLRELVRLTGEGDDLAFARLRSVQACLSKAGLTGPVTIRGGYEHGWVLLGAGPDRVLSTVLTIAGAQFPVAVAILLRGES